MNHSILRLILLILPLLGMMSCGPGSNRCSFDGRFLKMNQGEFRVYSPDGTTHGIDTITVRGGRFDYETECHDEGIVVIVLPNFYELPVFVKPGKTISLRADATHIKDIEITGTDANEDMTEWRKLNNDASPAKQAAAAEQFIRANPASIVSRWLLYKYLLSNDNPDYKKVSSLASLIIKASEGQFSVSQAAWMHRIESGTKAASAGMKGNRLAAFSATDIYGKSVKHTDYTKGYAVITLWANYSYESQNINRHLRSMKDSVKILSISIDASVLDTKDAMHRDSLPWHVVNEGKMWESPIVKKLGFRYLPDNIILKDGRIIARHIDIEEIKKLVSN